MKLQNASNNLEEMCKAVIEGKQLQWSANAKDWHLKHPHFLFTKDGLALHWRVKPDAFDEQWKIFINNFPNRESDLSLFDVAKYFWNAAIARKESGDA
ncbi:hypothetical protein ACFO4O_04135 [Glaciecola siphonariae]|uniref:Uncharacterized protein n=1 Tax=Glaciecola siphonariae TaxID=521012 RepID=A0ABV9LS70_9ALTE